MNDLAKFFAPLQKIDRQKNGSVRVAGIASSEAVDRDGEVIKADAIKAALPDFLRHGTGALREMHQSIAAGTVDEAIVEGGLTKIVATVVDQQAVKKVLAGVYKGFSVGGKVLGRDPKNKRIINKVSLTEISLVDSPANPDATFVLLKVAGAAPHPAEADIKKALDAMSEEDRALTLIKAARHFPRKIGGLK